MKKICLLLFFTIICTGCKKTSDIDIEPVNSNLNLENLSELTPNAQNEEDESAIINKDSKWNLSYIHEDIYRKLSDIIDTIDFYGTFTNECKEDNKTILNQYNKVLTKELSFINKIEGGFEGRFNDLCPTECRYYYYDMDKDGLSELIVSEDAGLMYVFKYDDIYDKVMLLSIILTREIPLGDNKFCYTHAGVGDTQGYYELNNCGDMRSDIYFYSEAYYNKKTQNEDIVYMVGFPDTIEGREKLKIITQDRKADVYFDDFVGVYYLKVTDEQYNHLSENLLRSIEKAEENIKDVTFTYEELFIHKQKSGSFNELDTDDIGLMN